MLSPKGLTLKKIKEQDCYLVLCSHCREKESKN